MQGSVHCTKLYYDIHFQIQLEAGWLGGLDSGCGPPVDGRCCKAKTYKV